MSIAHCPSCNRPMPKPRKAKATQPTPLEKLTRALYIFATFAIPTWPNRTYPHGPSAVSRKITMRPGILRLGACVGKQTWK